MRIDGNVQQAHTVTTPESHMSRFSLLSFACSLLFDDYDRQNERTPKASRVSANAIPTIANVRRRVNVVSGAPMRGTSGTAKARPLRKPPRWAILSISTGLEPKAV